MPARWLSWVGKRFSHEIAPSWHPCLVIVGSAIVANGDVLPYMTR
ncbi:hypothetical protein [Burkholderia ambifaria]